jgi:DNA-binding NarL/FixJ family response regulator
VSAVTVVIADDHPLFRDGLRALLSATPGFEVIGEADSGAEAVATSLSTQPDVVVMDLHMPGLGGIEATRRIVHTSPHVGVLVLTMLEDDESLFAALRAGARGYVLKGAAQEDIIRAIEAVARGGAIFGPQVAARMTTYFARAPQAALTAFPQLTEREREVLGLIAQGYNNTAIADRLRIQAKTVRNHVSNIFAKLHVADRAQAIVRAREAEPDIGRRTEPQDLMP